jgi:hypothetical protein
MSAPRNVSLLRILEDVMPTGECRAAAKIGVLAWVRCKTLYGELGYQNLKKDRIATFRVTFLNTLLRGRRDRRDDIKALLGSMALCHGQKSVKRSGSVKYPSVNGWL